ncbi:unnamed protein product [Calypogeia fissa]
MATHDDIRDVLATIARDTGYHVTMEQTNVLPAVDGIPDWRHADIVFSRARVQALADVVVADHMEASMVPWLALCPLVFSVGLALPSPFIGFPPFFGFPPQVLGFFCVGAGSEFLAWSWTV